MELQLALKGLEITRKKQKWVILMAAFGLTSYGFYRIYHFPAIAQKRKRALKLLGVLISIAEAVSDCTETIGVVSKDLNGFLQSESDQIPNSLKQVSKITGSNEFSQSIIRFTQALTVGILRGYQSEARSGNIPSAKSNSMDQVMDKLFTEAGAGFASVVVGSFARNLAMAAACSDGESKSKNSSEKNSVPSWLDVVSGDKCRELIGDCVQAFVGSMVAVYLEKTKDVNTFDEFFAGMTNPNHEAQVRNVLLTVCNGAIETLVKTCHEILRISNASNRTSPPVSPAMTIESEQDALLTELEGRDSFDKVKNDDDDDWVRKVSSTLAEPSKRKLVLDVTGRITFETVRSFLEVLLEVLCQAMKKCVNVAHEAAVETGLEIVRYVTAKSKVVATICLSLCLHVLGGVWILVPTYFLPSPSQGIL